MRVSVSDSVGAWTLLDICAHPCPRFTARSTVAVGLRCRVWDVLVHMDSDQDCVGDFSATSVSHEMSQPSPTSNSKHLRAVSAYTQVCTRIDRIRHLPVLAEAGTSCPGPSSKACLGFEAVTLRHRPITLQSTQFREKLGPSYGLGFHRLVLVGATTFR